MKYKAHHSFQSVIWTILLFNLFSCGSDEIFIPLNEDIVEVAMVTPTGNWINATNPGSTIRFEGSVTGLEKESYEHISVFWHSDQDGILSNAALDENGISSFESNSLTDVSHLITFGITNGTDSISQVTYILNGSKIDFTNLKVGQKSLYRMLKVNSRQCDDTTLEDKVFSLEVSSVADGIYTMTQRQLNRLVSNNLTIPFRLEDDSIKFLDEDVFMFDFVVFSSKSIPLKTLNTNPALESSGWCAEIEDICCSEITLYGYAENVNVNGALYPQVNVINEYLGTATDAAADYVMYTPEDGIIKWSWFSAMERFGLSFELIPENFN